MKTRTTLLLLLITLGVGAWLLFKESGSAGDAGGHLLFDWSDSASEQDKDKLRVDVDAAEVTGIDLKSSTVEVSLHREADGTWSLKKGVEDRADGALVKLLLDYLGTAKISDVISNAELKDGKVSESSLGLDDTGAWRVTWLNKDGKVLSEMRAGKTAPLGGACYVQLAGQKSRPDVYIVKPDIRPILARPLDSFRDPRACRYPEEQLQKIVVRKGEGEVELSRSMIPRMQPGPPGPDGKPGKETMVLEAGDWVITRPLVNAPAEQKVAKEFAAEICGLKVKGWLPYTETTDKPLVEVTVFPPVKTSKGVTLSFFPDPTAPEATAICRDAQRKAAFKVDKETVDYFALADSPNPFRSHKLPMMVEPAAISTVEVRTPQDSVVLVKTGSKWYWRPLAGGPWADAAVEKLEKLIEAVSEGEVLDFASDSLTDPKAFALDQPDYVVTFAAGRHDSLEKLTPIGVKEPGPNGVVVANRDESVPLEKRNYRSLRIAIRQDGQIFANYIGDPFVYRIGPEVPSSIPLSLNKWRTLALPGFSLGEVRSVKRTIGTQAPVEMKYDDKSLRWTVTQAGADVTPLYAAAGIENLVNKLGTLSVANWLEKPEDAEKALSSPAVTIEIEHQVYGERVADTKLTTTTLTLAPLPAAGAQLCYGKYTGVQGPFLIRIEALREMTADLLIKR